MWTAPVIRFIPSLRRSVLEAMEFAAFHVDFVFLTLEKSTAILFPGERLGSAMKMSKKARDYLTGALVSFLLLPGVVLLGMFLDYINLTFFNRSWPQSIVIPGYLIIESLVYLGFATLIFGTPIFVFLFLRERRRDSASGESTATVVDVVSKN
jgi:hypothetical protein